MYAGQILAVLQQAPMAIPNSIEMGQVVEQGAGTFAGLVQEMVAQTLVAAQTTEKADGAVTESPVLTSDEQPVCSDVMTGLLTALGASGIDAGKKHDPLPVDSDRCDGQETGLNSLGGMQQQNVMLPLNGGQPAVSANLTDGKMNGMHEAPAARQENPGEPVRTAEKMNNGPDAVLLVTPGTGTAEAPDKGLIEKTTVAATVQQVEKTVPGTGMPVRESGVSQPGLQPAEARRVMAVASPQPEVSAGVRDVPVPLRNSSITVSADVAPQKIAAATITAGAGAVPPQTAEPHVTERDGLVLVGNTKAAPHDSADLTDVSQKITQETKAAVYRDVSVVVASLEPSVFRGTEVTESTGVETAHSQSKPEEAHINGSSSPGKSRSLTLAAVDKAVVEGNGTPVMPTLLNEPSVTVQKVRPVPVMPFPVNIEGLAETAQIPQTHSAGEKTDTIRMPDASKAVGFTSSAEDAGMEGREYSGNGTNSAFQSHMLHQQVKPTDSSVSSSGAPAAVQGDQPRVVSPEQLVQQVKDRLVNHETKAGNEQIVLRLSPEHLGELRVNMNLDGQKLRVEIVAENRMVRDTLMQHTGDLRDSLARQNIKMESFDVTTGGNGAGNPGRSGEGWREFAQQRLSNAWIPSDGYRLSEKPAPGKPVFQAKSEHRMVDLHF